MQGAKTALVMEQFKIRPHKSFGQNFLKDDNILKKIVESSGVDESSTVIEIGPGLGALTAKLAQRAKRVIAVEIDRGLIPVLSETLRDYDNVEVICADILKVDLRELLAERNIGGDVFVVANLPYYITTPVIMKLLEEDITGDDVKCTDLKNITKADVRLRSITVMIQNEVAQRMQACPGSKDYGALSLAVGYRSKAGIVMRVSPDCFIPRPGVDSAVIRLDIYDRESMPVKTRNERLMFALIRASFGQRRKKLTNSVMNAKIPGIEKVTLENALTEMELDLSVRGEALSLSQFALLADKLTT